MADFTRRTNSDRELQPVAITSVDPISRTATGVTRVRTSVEINCAYATGDTITVPAVGEQWYVERFDLEWRLYGRIPFNDSTLNIEPEEGQVSVGSASGPLELNGTEIRANGRALRLNGVYYRDSGTTLQRSENGQDGWQPIFANATGNGTGGVLQMLANKLADIPVTPAVTEYLSKLTTEESTALTSLATWADGLGTGGGGGGGGWDLCNNDFFSDLRSKSTLTGTVTVQDEIVSGFQNFVNDLTSLLFCQYSIQQDGDVTPTLLAQKFGDLQASFTGQNAVGDFLRGLQNMLPGANTNLLQDSVQGAVHFVQELFDIFFCGANNTPALDPGGIVTQLQAIFDPLKENSFLLGLQDLVVNANRQATNLLRDSTEGAIKFIQTVFGVLNCNPAQPTPLINLVGLAGNATPSSSTPLGILASIKKTLVGTGGAGGGGLLNNFWVSAFNDIAGRQGYNGNLLNNITDAFSDVLSFVFDDVLGTLFPPSAFPKLDFKTIIKDFPNGFPSNLPTLQQWVDNLHLSDLLDPLHLGDWFKKNIFSPIFTAITGVVKDTSDAVAEFFQNPMQHITQFFTNVRKFFGADSITNWLDTFGGGGGILKPGFNPLAAVQSFITNMLGNTSGTNVLKTLWDTLVDGLTDASNNFIRALTGRPIIDSNGNVIETGFGAGLKAIRDFFAGFGFDPANPTSLLGKIVKEITGDDGKLTLDDLTNFFDPKHASNLFKDVVDTITKAITGLTNPFANFADSPLKALFELFDPDNAANKAGNFLKKIVDEMVSATTKSGTGPLAVLSQLFSGITFTGTTPKSLLTQLTDRIGELSDVLGVNSIVGSILNVEPDTLVNSYTLTVTGSPTGGSFRLSYGGATTGPITYSTTAATTAANIDAALAGLTITGASAPLGSAVVTVTNVEYTGGVRFLVALTEKTGILTLYSTSLTGGTSPAITVVQKFRGGIQSLQSFFNGFTEFTGSSGTKLLQQVIEKTGSDIANFVAKITGLDPATLLNPLKALENFFSGFSGFSWDGNLLTGSNNLVQQIVGKITGGLTHGFTELQQFFSNLRATFGTTNFLLPLGTGANNFKLADAANQFIKNLLSQATQSGLTALNAFIPAHALSNLGLEKITDLVKLITGTDPATGQHVTTLQTFFAGLSGVNSQITKTTDSLVSQIANAFMGKTTAQGLSDLKAFFGIGTTGGLLDFSGNNLLPIINQIVKAITGPRTTSTGASVANYAHPLSDITAFLGLGPVTDANTFDFFTGTNSILSQIVKKITGDAGTTLDHFNQFFKNLRGLLGIGSTTGLTPLTDLISSSFLTDATKLADAASRFVTNFLAKAGSGTSAVTAAISKIPATILSNLGLHQVTDLIKFLTGKDPANTTTGLTGVVTDIQAMFANLRALFGADATTGVSRLIPTGSFDAVNAANHFITNLINQASNSILNPTKILSVLGLNTDGSPKGTLFGDLTARPLLTDLRNWLTTTATSTSEEIHKFFTNLRTTLGLSSIDLKTDILSGNPLKAAQAAIHSVVVAVNSAVTDGTKWVTQTIADAKASIDSIAKAILGPLTGTATYGDLSGITSLFSPLHSTAGTSLLDKLAKIINNGTTSLADFFSGLNGANATNQSLIHKLIAPIIGTANDANGNPIAKTITDLQNFFSGFNTTTTATNSIAYKIAQSIGGSAATTLSHVQTFFGNLHTFLGLGTATGQPTLADFITTTFSTNTTKLKTTIDGFITSLNKGTGGKLSVDLLPSLDMSKIKDLISHLTGGVGSAAEDVKKFFTNLSTFLGGASGNGSLLTAIADFDIKDAVEHFISNVLKGPSILTKLVTLNNETSKLDGDLIPALNMDKINSLISHLTGSLTATADDVKKFFANLRNLFGTTDFLANPTGTTGATTFFDRVTAANQFIINVLSKATSGGIAGNTISADILSNFGVDKVVDLAKALTGRLATAATGDLAAIQKFFSGFSGFNPDGTTATTINNMVHQITNSIFGSNGTLANLKTFFSGFIPTTTADAFNTTSGANTLGHQITKAITGTNGLLTDILGFLGIGPVTDTTTLDPLSASSSFLNQIVKKVTGDGSTLTHLNQFFTNLRTAFGFTTPATLYSPTQTAESLQTTIFNVIKSFNSGTGGHALISQDKLKEWLGASSTNTLTQLGHFFTNIKTFFGGNNGSTNKIDLLSGPIAISTAIDDFIKGVVNKGTSGVFNVDLLPDLSIAKIKDLISHLTGGSAVDDVQKFFTNLRSLFGGTNFLAAPTGTTGATTVFDRITAANQFIINVLSKATKTGIAGNTISADILASFGVDKVIDLAKAVTGRLATAATGDLEEVRKFFSGFSGFDPSGTTPATINNMVHQITNSIFGANGTLANLKTFFSGFHLTPFNTTDNTNTLAHQITKALTGKAAGALADITTFLGLGAVGDATTFDPFSGANTFVSQLVKKITGDTSTTALNLTNLSYVFANLRTALGLGSTDLHTANSTTGTALDALRTNIFNVIKDFNAATGNHALISQDKLKEWLGVTGTDTLPALTQLNHFFANIKTFFGGNDGTNGKIDLLSGPIAIGTAIDNFIKGVVNKASSGLLSTSLLPQLDITKIKDLITNLTGKTGTTVADDVKIFFDNVRTMLNHGTTTGQTNFNATQTADTLQKGLLGVITTINTQLGTALNALVSHSTMNGFLGGTAATDIKRFFDNLKTLFGGPVLLPAAGTNFSPSEQIGKLFPLLSAAPGLLAPGKIATATGATLTGTTGTLLDDIFARPVLSDLTDWITNSASSANQDIRKFFTNLQATLGNPALLTGFNAGTAQKAIHDVVSAINSQQAEATKWVTQTVAKAKADIDTLVKAITGGTGTYGDLSRVTAFFGDLGDYTGTGTTLINQIVGKITGDITHTLTDMGSFFTNLKGFLGFNPGSGYSLSTAVNNFFTSLNTVTPTTKIDPAKLLSTISIGQIGNLVSHLTGTGSTSTDLQTYFTNLRSTLGLGSLDLKTAVLTGDPLKAAQKSIHDVVVAINAAQADATKWATEAVAKTKANIAEVMEKITGTGASTLDNLGPFFTNLKGFLGFNPGSGYSLGTAVTNFFASLNGATGVTTKIDPAKLLDTIGIGQIGNLVSHLTGGTGTGSTDLQTYFTNLRSTLGLGAVDLKTAVLSGDPLKAAQKAIHDVVSAINAAAADTTKWATEATAKAKANIADIVQKITGVTGAGNLDTLGTFFTGLTGTGGTSLISQIVGKITGGINHTLTDLGIFFSNFTSLFGGINFSSPSASFSAASAASTFTSKLLGGSGLIPKLNNNLLTIVGAPTSGNYRLSYGDNATDITGTISCDSGYVTIQSALEALPGIGVGNVTVTAQTTTSFEISIDNLNSELKVYSKALSGGIDADVSLDRQINTTLIPKLNVDWIRDLEDWVNRNLIEPLVSTLRGASGDVDAENNGLTGLGAWAANLLHINSKIPADNLDGTISNSLLGVIPVSNISNVSPNLLAQGDFSKATNLDTTDDWSWDDGPESRTNGSAKLAFTTTGVKELFSQQKIPVAQGDNLTLSAYVKTSSITNGTATYTVVITGSPTAGTFRLTYGGQTSSSIAYNAPTSVVAEALNDLPAIGDGGAIVSGIAGSYYTVSINNLASALTATSDFFGPRLFSLNITGSPFAGKYVLGYNGATVATALDYNANAASIQNALTALAPIGPGNATVTGSGSTFSVAISGSAPTTLGAASALTTRTQTISLSNAPTGGTFTLTYGSTGVVSTPAMAHNITPANLQAELVKLDAVTSATVTGTAGTSYTVWLDNQASTLAVSSSLLSNTTMPGISIAPITTTNPSIAVTGSGTAVAPYLVTVSGSPTGSTFTLSYGGQTTQGLAYNAAPDQVRAALELLTSIGPGKVAVTGTAGSYSVVLTVATSTLTAASTLTDSDYTLTLTNVPTSGTFTLTYGGQTTAPIAYNAPATGTGSVQAALEALSNIVVGEVTVTGSAGSYVTAFKVPGTFTGSATALRNATSPVTTLATATVTSILDVGGRYTVSINGAPTAGSFTLGYGGQTTAPIVYNADAAGVRTALEALTGIGPDNVVVTAITGGFTVDIANYTGTLSLVSNSLVSATVASVAVTNNHRTPTGSNVFAVLPSSAPNGGTFTLNYGGSTTATALPYTATATEVQNALVALAPIGSGNATVTGSQGAFTATIKATKRTLSATDTFMSLTTFTPGVSITESAPLKVVSGGSYSLALTGTPTGGSYTLAYGGQATGSIAYSANAATIQAALSALSTIGVGKVGVVGTASPFSIAISGEAATLTVNSSALTGGTAPKVSVEDKARPITLSLIPHNNTTQLSTANIVTARPVSAWTQITGNWTVPANVTSVFPRLAYGGTATSGNVWFDDASLTKTGLMQQSLVERLIEGWQGLWDGAFGTGGSDKTSDDVKDVLGFVSTTASNGVTNAAGADGKAQTIVDGIHEAMTGTAPAANATTSPNTVKTNLQSLNFNLFGKNTLSDILHTDVIPDITAGMSTDLRGVFNNLVLGLQGKTDTTINGANLPSLSDIFKTTKTTNESIATLSTALAGLQTTATNQTNSGKSDYTDFTDFVPFNNGTGVLYSGSSSSALASSGGQASWQVSGQGTRWAQGVLTRTATASNWQKVGIAFATAPEADWLTNGNAAYNYILGRVNNTYTPAGGTAVPRGSHYVFVKFSKTGFTVGYTTTGTSATPTEILFPAPAGQSWPVAHDFTPGAVYYLECGTEGGATIYRVSRNGTPLATLAATTAYPYTDSDHRFSGFKVQATSNNVWTNKPGTMAAFAVADNTPAEYIGSGFRRFRSVADPLTIAKGDANGYSLLPDNFFGSTSYATPDYTYTSSSVVQNKIAVATTGWYQVSINLGLANSTMLTEIAPTLYKNGVLTARGGSVWGQPGFPARSASQTAATFTVYLQQGEYIQPGYWQNPSLTGSNGYASGSWSPGDSSGVTSYLSVAFLNRSTAN